MLNVLPAMKAFVCVPSVPMRVVPASPATPAFEMSMLFDPGRQVDPGVAARSPRSGPVLFEKRFVAVATLSLPVVLAWSAAMPLAILLLPVLLESSAVKPLAILLSPVLFKNSALKPIARLKKPVVFENNASSASCEVVAAGGVAKHVAGRSQRCSNRWCFRAARCGRSRCCCCQ